MDLQIAVSLAYPVGLGLAAMGAAIGLGLAAYGALISLGRQPEASGKIMVLMILGCAFIEACAIYALISIFIVQIVVPGLK